MSIWHEIDEFKTPEEYDRFQQKINELVNLGEIREIPVSPDCGPGEIYGGRWFLNQQTEQVWRLVAPDFPFRGLWEPLHKNK